MLEIIECIKILTVMEFLHLAVNINLEAIVGSVAMMCYM